MDSEIELRHLRYFVAVAEELHFGRAAQRLHLAQPPLSQQIRRLEELLGHQLFFRTSRSVALTAAGEAFLQSARRTLRNVQRDLDEARSVGRGEVGSLHIGFVGSAILATLPAMLRAYGQAYPRVRLHLHESFTSSVLAGLENGSLDAGILRDGDPVPGLEIHTIFSEPYVAVLPMSHPLARQKSISAASLRNDPLVFHPRTAGVKAFEKPLSLFDQTGPRPQIVQEASHWVTILELVGAGLGITIAPACVRRIASPDIVCLPIRNAKITSNIELALHETDNRPIVRQFAQIAKQNARADQRKAPSR